MFAFLYEKSGWRKAGRRSVALAVAIMALAVSAPADADDGDDGDASVEIAAREIWSGAENTGSTWAFYTGLGYAPGGASNPGLRFRLVMGMSTYDYATTASVSGRAAQPFADLLAGYQWQVGPVTMKAFAGGTGSADIRTLEQALDPWAQARIGLKLAGESWWTIDPNSWASLDTSFASGHNLVWSRMRYGYRLLPKLSLGPEAGLAGEAHRPAGRIGAFARFDWERGEIAVSGGIAQAPSTSTAAHAQSGKSTATPYLTLLWLQRF